MYINKAGLPFIIVPIVAGFLFLIFTRSVLFSVLGWLFVVIGLFCAFFFRDPVRQIPEGENLIISPCDGTVMEIGEENGMKVVRVFLSVFNVHIQRSPVAGTISSVEYRPGKFLPAMNVNAHSVNEQNIITIQTSSGVSIIVKQIAGILARRVVAWNKAGDSIKRGERIGLIKFGSQVDLYCPLTADIKLKIGDKVVAGETIFGELK